MGRRFLKYGLGLGDGRWGILGRLLYLVGHVLYFDSLRFYCARSCFCCPALPVLIYGRSQGILALAFLGLRGHLRVVFSLSVLAVLIEVPMVIPDFVSFATGLLGKDASFTGRTDLWAVAIRMIMAHPWLGYGRGSLLEYSGPVRRRVTR